MFGLLLPSGEGKRVRCKKPQREQKVEECDATMFKKSSTVRPTKRKYRVTPMGKNGILRNGTPVQWSLCCYSLGKKNSNRQMAILHAW